MQFKVLQLKTTVAGDICTEVERTIGWIGHPRTGPQGQGEDEAMTSEAKDMYPRILKCVLVAKGTRTRTPSLVALETTKVYCSAKVG